MKAVFLDFATMGPGLDLSSLRSLLPELELFDMSTAEQAAIRMRDAEFVLANKMLLTDALMQGSPRLRFIGLTATGTNNVDLSAAERRGIAVCNIRAYCTQSVTEHVFGLLLNITHSLSQYNAAVRAGDWQRAGNFCLISYPIRDLSAMTLGIVGYGELGKGVAKTAKAFGMEVIISCRPGTRTIASGRVSFDELLQRSDVISLHCPLTEATAGLFGEREFRKMKSNAILINTARGGLVDSAALVAALAKGDIFAAAIDVLPEEPPVNGDPLLDYDGANLVMTPHVAWGSNEARQAAIEELARNVAAFLQGENRNRVQNPAPTNRE
ncbi:MAG: D-2-hydroxyacid dehydrogenase [Gammaproteobacteria bacterium]|nr:D-2-hydroxyacid dehydrogenase [Gammaproteobacteria bacterium]